MPTFRAMEKDRNNYVISVGGGWKKIQQKELALKCYCIDGLGESFPLYDFHLPPSLLPLKLKDHLSQTRLYPLILTNKLYEY
ncbi:hypothetical protein VNO78_22553 [Psophocarpus tetragonolobus]|uniref:Uncharacterized protein n=1 Tax=Psophocarpus tetragonolobus TaxID=3891 RepID=A0AAN9S371_PSOTE